MTPTKIIIHHSATLDTGSLSWGAIRHHHTYFNGWDDIGYHAGCELALNGYECLYGRPLTVAGAHAAGENHDSLGFCFVGDYDRRPAARSMLETAARLVLVPWLLQFGLSVDSILPHSDFSAKTCPGILFDMPLLRKIVAEELTKGETQ